MRFDAGVVLFMIPIVGIICGTVLKIARIRAGPIGRVGSDPEVLQRLDACEQELSALRQELSDTQERLDFAERLLAKAKETRELSPPDRS